MRAETLPETMKALVVHSLDRYVLETAWPRPKAGPGEVILKVELCGICAGDVKARQGARRIWENYAIPPFSPGHEFFGTVVETGDHVDSLSIGDCVVSEQVIPCGKCLFCRTGRYWMCEDHDVYGFRSHVSGAMAEYVKLPANARNYKIPAGMSSEKALLVEPFSCSKHAVDRADIGLEDTVVVSGCGTLGLGMITIARMKNPKTLIALDLIDSRLEKAREFGADIAMNPMKVDAAREIKNMTGGYGCDIYIEATGHPASVSQGMAMIRKQGRFVEFSVFGQATTLDWSVIGDEKELDILGVSLSPYCFPAVIDWISLSKIKTDGIVSHILPLDDWEKAFELAKSGSDSAIKVALRP